jgi:hypothetical protein
VATDLLKSLPEAFRRTRKGAGQKVAKVSG